MTSVDSAVLQIVAYSFGRFLSVYLLNISSHKLHAKSKSLFEN